VVSARSNTLRSSEERFAWSLVEASPDAVLVVAADGTVVFANDRAGALFGSRPEQLIEALLSGAFVAAHFPDRTRDPADLAGRDTGDGLDVRARRSDGSELAVEVTLSAMGFDDVVFTVAAVRDVSARVDGDAELRRVLRTLDASNDAIFIIDATTMVFSFVNDGAVRLTGYERAELLTMTPLNLDPYTSEAEQRAILGSIVANEEASLLRVSTIRRRDGSEVPVEITFQSGRVRNDRHTWVITLARDIGPRLAHEEEVGRSAQARRDVEALVAVVADRERIARNLHDNVIQRLFGECLRLQSALPLLDESSATRARTTIELLDDTIRELRTSVFSLQGAVAAPGGLRGRILSAVSDSAAALGFDPRLQFDGPIETMDQHISEELLSVLREALSNIAQHADAQAARVAVDLGSEVVLTVSDDGVGVPEEVIGGRGVANMFERAHRLGGDADIANQRSGGAVLTWRVPASRGVDDDIHQVISAAG